MGTITGEEVESKQLDYKPKWWFIVVLIITLSIQALHGGYGNGTYNRIRFILLEKYKWDAGQRSLYEGLISSLFVLGLTVGRLFGAWFTQKGRKRLLLTSAGIALAAIAI